jgi:WNK lysine deficient protein kinase
MLYYLILSFFFCVYRYIRNFKGQKEEKRINVMKKWCRQILKGLAYLHSRNPPVIHRDLKCDNVFISSTTGCVKIGDLGLATFKTQTFAKSMRGTMEFMAPEMFDEQYNELVDIYSFGLCMLEMITGEYPYIECKGPTAVIKRVSAGLKPDCYWKVKSEDVREVIDCCIRTKKEERLSVHDLLQHSFFLDDNSLRIDLVRDSSNDSTVMIKNGTIDLKLKIVDKAKRKALYAENKVSSTVFEAILFPYNLNTDTPEKIADELIGKNYIFEDDKKFVIQSIKDRVRALDYEIIDRQAGVFPGNRNPTTHQTQQPSIMIQQQPQQQIAPLISVPQVTPVAPVTAPITSVTQQALVEQQQHIVKPSSEIPVVKPVVTPEPTAITQLPELSPNIPGSAVSLEELEAALKKTFTKNSTQGTNTTSTLANDTGEPPTPLLNQDDSLIPKPTPNNAVIEQSQQQIEEPGLPIPSEPSTSK